MPGNESVIYGYLQTLIGNPVGEAALLGNFDVETGGSFSPKSYNANEGAIGIAQWELGRRTALDTYANAHGGSETDLSMQLGYLTKELTGPYSNVLNYLRTAKDPAAAAAYVDANFERSSGSTRAQRMSDAQTIYHQIQSGALTPTGGSVIGGSVHDPGGIVGIINDATNLGGKLANPFSFDWVIKLVLKGTFTLAGLALAVLGMYAAAHRPEAAS